MSVNSQVYLRQRKAKRKRIKIFLAVALAASLLASLFYFLFFSGYFNISGVAVSGVDGVPADEVRKTVIASGSKNIFLFSTAQAESDLRARFPFIKEAEVKKRFWNKLTAGIVKRLPAGIACGAHEQSKECFYFDEDGVIFEPAPEILGSAFIMMRDDSIAGSVLSRQKYSKETVVFTGEFKKLISEMAGLSVEYFSFLDQSGDMEAQTGKGFKIFITQTLAPMDQARAAKSLLDREIKEKINNLEYIDLRVENRAYYKLRE